jgi:Neuraminidase (sialidase)
MFVSKSIDGGMTWSNPITMTPRDWTWGKWHDKNAITANPLDPDLVHATWTLFHGGNTSIAYSDSMDAGLSWSKPTNIISQRPVKDTGPPTANNDSQAGAQIVVLNDGTLVNLMSNTVSENQGNAGYDSQVSILRSFDDGGNWERDPIYIADIVPTVRGFWTCSAFDVELEVPVRDGQCFIPDIAVNFANNKLYVVWQDAWFNPDGLAGAVISMSSDGGDTWTDPIQVNQVAPESQAFLPTVEVADDGTVGVLFYDFRNDRPGDAALDTDVHLAFFDGDLNHLGEKRLTSESFNIRQMVIAGSRGYFPGDYVGLSHAGNDFVSAFTVANELGLPVDFPQDSSTQRIDDNNRQDIVFGRASLSDITGEGKSK